MKKIKLIIPATCCLLATSLFSCAQKSEQPISNFYKISIVNAAKGAVEQPNITFESSNFIEKGKDCDVYVRFEDYCELNYLEDSTDYYRIRKSNFLSEGDVLEKGHHIEATDDPCVYKIHIDKEYMTTSYDVIVNCSYVDGKYNKGNIKFKSESNLGKMTDLYVTNTSSRYDLTFILMPKNFQSGYTFDGETKDAIEIWGVKDGSRTENLTDYLTRKELVRCDSPIQGLSHYLTDTKSLRIAIPVDKLYEQVEPSETFIYGYKPKFDEIEIASTKDDDAPVAYDKEHYDSFFNLTVDQTSCHLNSSGITFNSDGEPCFEAKFTASSGYTFYEAEPVTDIVISPKTYTSTGHPFFHKFEVHSDVSKRKDIQVSPTEAYNGNLLNHPLLGYTLDDENGNIYVPMKNWITINDGVTDLSITINIAKMVKFIEFPTTTIIGELDLLSYGTSFANFYRDGSIDFISSIDLSVRAI